MAVAAAGAFAARLAVMMAVAVMAMMAAMTADCQLATRLSAGDAAAVTPAAHERLFRAAKLGAPAAVRPAVSFVNDNRNLTQNLHLSCMWPGDFASRVLLLPVSIMRSLVLRYILTCTQYLFNTY